MKVLLVQDHQPCEPSGTTEDASANDGYAYPLYGEDDYGHDETHGLEQRPTEANLGAQYGDPTTSYYPDYPL